MRAMKNAATPASDICINEIWPVYPVSTTSESMMIMNTSEVWIALANTVRMPLFSKTKAKKATTVVHTTALGDPDRVRRQRQPLLDHRARAGPAARNSTATMTISGSAATIPRSMRVHSNQSSLRSRSSELAIPSARLPTMVIGTDLRLPISRAPER